MVDKIRGKTVKNIPSFYALPRSILSCILYRNINAIMNILACSGQDGCYPTGRKHSIWLHADKEQENIIIRSIIFYIRVNST